MENGKKVYVKKVSFYIYKTHLKVIDHQNTSVIGLWNRGRSSLLAGDNTMMGIFYSVQYKQDCKVFFFTTTKGKIHVEGNRGDFLSLCCTVEQIKLWDSDTQELLILLAEDAIQCCCSCCTSNQMCVTRRILFPCVWLSDSRVP